MASIDAPTFSRVSRRYYETLLGAPIKADFVKTAQVIGVFVTKKVDWEHEWEIDHPGFLDKITQARDLFNAAADAFELEGQPWRDAVESADRYVKIEHPDVDQAGRQEEEAFNLFLATKMLEDLQVQNVSAEKIPDELPRFIQFWQSRLTK